jgi:hypothetical protein
MSVHKMNIFYKQNPITKDLLQLNLHLASIKSVWEILKEYLYFWIVCIHKQLLLLIVSVSITE